MLNNAFMFYLCQGLLSHQRWHHCRPPPALWFPRSSVGTQIGDFPQLVWFLMSLTKIPWLSIIVSICFTPFQITRCGCLYQCMSYSSSEKYRVSFEFTIFSVSVIINIITLTTVTEGGDGSSIRKNNNTRHTFF